MAAQPGGHPRWPGAERRVHRRARRSASTATPGCATARSSPRRSTSSASSTRRPVPRLGRPGSSWPPRAASSGRSPAARAGRSPDPADYLHCRYDADGVAGPDDWPTFQLDGPGIWLWSLGAPCRERRGSLRRTTGAGSAARGAVPRRPLGRRRRSMPGRSPRSTSTRARWRAILAGLRARRRSPAARRIRGSIARGRVAIAERRHRERLVDARRALTQVGRQPRPSTRSLLWIVAPYGLVDAGPSAVRRRRSRASSGARVARRRRPSLRRGHVLRRRRVAAPDRGARAVSTSDAARPATAQRAEACLALDRGPGRTDGTLPEQVATRALHPERIDEWRRAWGESACPLLWSHATYLALRAELGRTGRPDRARPGDGRRASRRLAAASTLVPAGRDRSTLEVLVCRRDGRRSRSRLSCSTSTGVVGACDGRFRLPAGRRRGASALRLPDAPGAATALRATPGTRGPDGHDVATSADRGPRRLVAVAAARGDDRLRGRRRRTAARRARPARLARDRRPAVRLDVPPLPLPSADGHGLRRRARAAASRTTPVAAGVRAGPRRRHRDASPTARSTARSASTSTPTPTSACSTRTGDAAQPRRDVLHQRPPTRPAVARPAAATSTSGAVPRVRLRRHPHGHVRPAAPRRSRRDGEPIDFAALYPGPDRRGAPRVVAAARAGARVLFNCVEGFPLEPWPTAPAAALYLELWPPDVAYADVVRWIERARRSWARAGRS